jgi:small subunit ribosomal protein S18
MAEEINNAPAPRPEPPERSERPDRPQRPERPERGRGRFQRRRICAFCADKVENIDYKDVGLLRRFLSDQAQIESRRRTGTCAKHQRRLTTAIKRARHLALLPYTAEHIRRSNL